MELARRAMRVRTNVMVDLEESGQPGHGEVKQLFGMVLRAVVIELW